MRSDIGAAEAHKLVQQGRAVLVDVRDAAEFAEEHVDGAVSLPLGEFTPEKLAQAAAGKTAVVMCKSGVRSGRACEVLEAEGDVRLLSGGLAYWVVAGLPTVRARHGWWPTLPLERRVQVVVGLLVLTFSLLALLASPWFALGAVLIGGGLVNAGLTGWCGMAKILARL